MASTSSFFFPFDEAVTLNNSSRIIGILQRIKERRLMLNAKIEGVKGLFRTAILEVNSKKQLVVFDELSPSDGHKLITKGKEVYLSTLLDGVDIHIPLTIKAIKNDSKGAMYHAQLPDQIVYKQRRQHFRVQPHASSSLEIYLHPEGQESIHGQIADISISGVGAIILDVDSAFHPHPGDRIPAEIKLPEETLTTDVEVRFVAQLERESGLKIGAMFTDVDQNHKRMMERIVAQLQRELLQRR